MIPIAHDSDALQRRVLALGEAALEGQRPLSDLLGEALSELQFALSSIRKHEADLRQKDEVLSALQAEPHPERGASVAPMITGPFASVVAGTGEEEPLGLAPDFFPDSIPAEPNALERDLRMRIAEGLYLGTLNPGDRLPSVRELSRRTGVNHKIIRRVYGSLERSGLVVTRARSGIYVAEREVPMSGTLGGVEAWIADVLVEGVLRGVHVDRFLPLLQRCIGTRRLQCACVESAEDDRFALSYEIRQQFGMETMSVNVAQGNWASNIQGVDLVVTTPFHAEETRRALRSGQALVVARLNSAVPQALTAASWGKDPRQIICVDPVSGNRLRHGLSSEVSERVEVVTVDQLPSIRREQLGAAGIVTLAAWAQIGDGRPPPSHLPVPAYLSAQTARQIARILVFLNCSASE